MHDTKHNEKQGDDELACQLRVAIDDLNEEIRAFYGVRDELYELADRLLDEIDLLAAQRFLATTILWREETRLGQVSYRMRYQASACAVLA